VNDLPLATAQSVATDEDTAITVTLQATDPDADALTFSLFDGTSQVSSLTTTNGATVVLSMDAAGETYIEQWASTVVDFSSEYSTGSWSASQTRQRTATAPLRGRPRITTARRNTSS
jgi:hypothetical protein